MITIIIPLIVAVIGLLMWVLASNAKVQEMGKILFFVGALWSVYIASQKSIHF